MRSSTRSAIIFIAACVIVLLAWILHPRPEPPQTAIADQISYAVAGANAHSAGQVLSVVSSDYDDNHDLNATSLRVLLARVFSGANNATTTLTNPIIAVQGDSATSDTTITVKGQGGETYFNQPVHMIWRKEMGKAWLIFPIPIWRIVHADYGQGLDSGD